MRISDWSTDVCSSDLSAKSLVWGSLKLRQRWGARPWSCQIFTTDDAAIPTALAIARTVQWVASWLGVSSVSFTTLSTKAASRGATPGGRVLSRSNPSTPSAMNLSCQRHTHVLDFPRSEEHTSE